MDRDSETDAASALSNDLTGTDNVPNTPHICDVFAGIGFQYQQIRGRARRLAVGPIESDRPLADLPGDPFVARRGREAVLTYVNGTNGAAPQLRERFRDVNEIGVNLEDLFVDLLGAPREEVVA